MRGQGSGLFERSVAWKNELATAGRRAIRSGRRTAHRQLVIHIQTTQVCRHIAIGVVAGQRVVVAITANR